MSTYDELRATVGPCVLLESTTPSGPHRRAARAPPRDPAGAVARRGRGGGRAGLFLRAAGAKGGALFYATPSGRLDANILIRSAVVADGRVTFHTGGGIVADSDPDAEYEETLHKAEGLRLALEAAESVSA